VIRRLEQDHLSADLAAVEELLSSAPPGDVLGRMSLTERRDEVRKALTEVESRREIEGRTALFFGGAPVIGSRGVDADFAAEAVGKYQDLVTKVWAFKEHGSLAPSGPVPDRHEARLHVTNVVHGSFGFELAGLQGPLTLGSSSLHDAISPMSPKSSTCAPSLRSKVLRGASKSPCELPGCRWRRRLRLRSSGR
jgi:hypothetical protein